MKIRETVFLADVYLAPSRGQIWLLEPNVSYPDGRTFPLTADRKAPNMVLVMGFDADFETNPNSIVRVFPISTTMWLFADSYDLVLPDDVSPISNHTLMIECWNRRPMLRRNLLKPLATVDERVIEDVQYLQTCHLHSVQPDRPLQSAGYIGPPLQPDHDPRIKFKQEEFKRTDFLTIPVNALNEVMQLDAPMK